MTALLNPFDQEYHRGLLQVREEGTARDDRTGTGTISLFGDIQMKFDLRDGYFPLLTTKKVFFKGIVEELLWFLDGDTNIKRLVDKGVHIWDQWAKPNGDLGQIYSAQWRAIEHNLYMRWDWAEERFGIDVARALEDEADYQRDERNPFRQKFIPVRPGVRLELLEADIDYVDAPLHLVRLWIDQMTVALDQIKNNPDSRRIIVSAWNVAELDEMALPPCHTMFQFYVDGEHLHCKLYQRSGDMFLGVPFNFASYSLLTMMVAQVCGLKPGIFYHTIGDAHIYQNHLEQVDLQLGRAPKAMPRVRLNPSVTDLFAFTSEDIVLEGYDSWPAIKGAIAV